MVPNSSPNSNNQFQRLPTNTEFLEEEPLYVNAKQYKRILKRRQARAKLEAEGKIPKTRQVINIIFVTDVFAYIPDIIFFLTVDHVDPSLPSLFIFIGPIICIFLWIIVKSYSTTSFHLVRGLPRGSFSHHSSFNIMYLHI